jgi:hypothetical protein
LFYSYKQCCQLLACVFCQINRKNRPLTKKLKRGCFCWRFQRFLSQNITIKFVRWIRYFYKLYKILWKIHTSKKFGPFSAIFRQICWIFGRSYFYGATFAFCGRNFGRLGTLLTKLFVMLGWKAHKNDAAGVVFML